MKLLRVFFRILKVLFILLLIVAGYLLAEPLWNHFVTYPTLEADREALWQQYRKPQHPIPLPDYQGVLHAHCYWSHDSRGVLSEIVPAAKQAQLDFLFFSDHKRAPLDTFPRAYHGTFDGLIVESGTESDGLMVTPLRPTVINWKQSLDTVIRSVVEPGGLVLYVHTEEPHDWGNPDYQAMEIYNIHTDLIDEKSGILPFVLNSMVNSGRFKHWGYRELYDEQTAILARWDSLNQHRRIVGMGAADAHNNQSIRARYTKDGMVEWVGSNAKTMRIVKPGLLEKLLLGKPDAAGWAYKAELDTYFHSFNFINTHIFCDTLSSRALKNGLVKGHAYISFENLAKAKGFGFYSTDARSQLNAIMGDSVKATSVSRLKAVSPYPVTFELFRNGKQIDRKENAYDYAYSKPVTAGNYRLVARVHLGDKWVPWVYTNPIYVY
ncbi:hypothetical protein [Arsenicibacter rosenii]|uniref:Histidinol-phosphatase n=1 Tax=Arsenicibacter rosenii TaxID=1750698 RepID=A0A1S2VE94_9BACT|nr:hypothetical protein [Arsenicibacter rosenii]OIN56740.1 hypothetical protein BLX24_23470 [Arsenicibacter rosenii]